MGLVCQKQAVVEMNFCRHLIAALFHRGVSIFAYMVSMMGIALMSVL